MNTKETALEAGKVLDALSALAVDLSCDCEIPADTLILSAQKTRDACAAIDEAVLALKTIIRNSEAAGGGPLSGKA
jgi:ribosome-associated translation inhibitor RaiA